MLNYDRSKSSVGFQTVYVGTVGTLTSFLLFVFLVIRPRPRSLHIQPLPKRSGPINFIELRDDFARSACNEPARRTYNAMRAEDLLELVSLLRTNER
jgi:hypothetical protein